MLSITCLNAGRGDCLVLEASFEGDSYYGVIDANAEGQHRQRLHDYLTSKGITKLNFLALTHPHADHYRGLLKIMTDFPPDTFYIFPLDVHLGNSERLKKMLRKYNEMLRRTDDRETTQNLEEFIRLLALASHTIARQGNLDEPNGPMGEIFIPGFKQAGIKISCLLPFKSVKGLFGESIDADDFSVVDYRNSNDLSLAFLVEYGGKRIILGGDGTKINWLAHQRKFNASLNSTRSKADYVGLKANAVKLPHHGSDVDSAPEVIDYLFSDRGDRYALISANGTSHPHGDVLTYLSDRGISPYCTNLAKQCGNNRVSLNRSPEFLPELDRSIALFSLGINDPGTPCQGNITITVLPTGETSVSTETGAFCPYRPI